MILSCLIIERKSSPIFEICKNLTCFPLCPQSEVILVMLHSCGRCVSHSKHSCAAQVLRSCGRWSSGISSPESSIYEAYLAAIASAQHFIYIENQFFISSTEENDVVVNKVCAAIVERILHMHKLVTFVMTVTSSLPLTLASPLTLQEESYLSRLYRRPPVTGVRRGPPE